MPVEATTRAQTYAGALIRRGAEVAATGGRTRSGQTVELIRGAHVVSSQQKAVLSVVRNLALFNCNVVVGFLAYRAALKLSTTEIISVILTAVLASIPVALPAKFPLAGAIGARVLAGIGVTTSWKTSLTPLVDAFNRDNPASPFKAERHLCHLKQSNLCRIPSLACR